MSGPAPAEEPGSEPAYHLLLEAEEARVAESALRLLISDEAHEPAIRALAREVIDGLQAKQAGAERVTVALNPQQMKITYSAVKLLLNDLQREQAAEREILRQILDKLPDEHTMRAIQVE
jgi:hypothetical protein